MPMRWFALLLLLCTAAACGTSESEIIEQHGIQLDIDR